MKTTGFNLVIVLILSLATNTNAFSQKAIKQSLDSIVSERSKYIYSYDDNGNNTLNAGYNWNDTNNSWVGDYKQEYAYDKNSNQTLHIYYYWDNTNNNLERKYEN